MMSNEMKINEKKSLTSNFDKIIYKQIQEESEKENVDPIVRPLIFCTDSENSTEHRPIITSFPINMMYDSNLELIDKKIPMKDIFDNEMIRDDIYSELFFDQRFTIIETLKNMIIETSSLTFNNYWKFVNESLLHLPEKYAIECINVFIYHLRSNEQEIIRFIGGFATTIESVHLIYEDKMLDSEVYHPLFTYVDQKSIIMSQYISGLMGQSIYEFLFDKFVNNRDDILINMLLNDGSVIIKGLLEDNKSDINAFIYSLISKAIYPSFYNLTMYSINPSIGNILSSGINSLFTLYNDVKHVSNKISKED